MPRGGAGPLLLFPIVGMARRDGIAGLVAPVSRET